MEKACIRPKSTRKKLSIQGPVMNHVPDCMMYEILLKLPVRTLVRFRLVSKSWRDLISSPQFVKSHLAVTTLRGEENKSRMNYVRFAWKDPRTIVCRLSILDPQASKVRTICLNTNRFETCPTILGSCNGLILFHCHVCFWLWNPWTGEYKKFADCAAWPLERLQCRWTTHCIYGLGYDSILKDYKAVILCSNRCNGSQQTYMYLGTTNGHWRRLNVSSHDFPYRINGWCNNSKVTINGSPHWAVSDYRANYCENNSIIFFDMAEEKMKSLATTPHTASRTGNLKLSILGGCLCATYSNFTDHCSDIWVMKEYGVKESWTKLFVIRRLEKPRSLRPIGFRNKGVEMVLEIAGHPCNLLVSYNIETQNEKLILSSNSNCAAIISLETLISP